MIQEDYATFKQATDLKELGFDIPCYTFYDAAFLKDDKPQFVSGQYLVNHNANPEYDAIISAPSLSLVQKWLREKDIFIEVVLETHHNGTHGFLCEIYGCRRTKDYPYSTDMFIRETLYNMEDDEYNQFSNYEETLSVGINKCIEILKESEFTVS